MMMHATLCLYEDNTGCGCERMDAVRYAMLLRDAGVYYVHCI